MKYLPPIHLGQLATIILMVLVSCKTPITQDTNTVTALIDAGSSASADIGSARNINRDNPQQNQHTNVLERVLETAQDKLPIPTAEQALAALERDYAALKATNEDLARIYAKEKGHSRKLADALDSARKKDAEEAAKNDRLVGAKIGMARILIFAGIGFLAAGGAAFFAFKNTRLAIVCGVLSVVCHALAWMMVAVPNQHIVVLFWVVVAAFVAIPCLLFYGYKVGLFQKPETKIKRGDYVAELQPI